MLNLLKDKARLFLRLLLKVCCICELNFEAGRYTFLNNY